MSEKTSTPFGDVVWTRHDLPMAPLSYRGHLRLLQGASLGELFLPLLLLRGTPDPIWRVPFGLRGAVFAEVHQVPDGASVEQITLELMKFVLAQARDT